jgi:hypothetical protein
LDETRDDSIRFVGLHRGTLNLIKRHASRLLHEELCWMAS